MYKKINNDYNRLLQMPNTPPEVLTRYLDRKDRAFAKSRNAANASNKANERVKSAFYNTINNTLNNHTISPKNKFKILLRLMKNNKYSGISPLYDGNDICHDPEKKSQIFNNYFASKTNLAGKLDDVPILTKKDCPELAMLNSSPLEVGKLIRNLKKSHMSPCGISGKFLQLISKEISYSLSKLLNNLFEIGHFPELWKIAHVTPIFKKSGSKNCKTNYRPISILPTLSKVCESIIHERLLFHCIRHKIITERQAAYLKGDSTISQLLYIIHQIRTSWGKGNLCHGVFLDISSAFDKVWHKGLLAKLEQIGMSNTVLKLFEEYLSNRKQCVVVDGIRSSFLNIEAGVPQGSRLGPLLFIIYINDIVEGLESEILIFADDCSLLASGLDPSETAQQLNRDLEI